MNNRVLHFLEGFSLNEINDVLSKREDVIYYTRYIQEKHEFHVVKYKDGKFNITQFTTQLFGFYKNNEQLSILITETTIKGNDSFAIISNTNDNLIEHLKKDLNILLKN